MRKSLSKKKLSVLDDLFSSDLSEQQVLEKHKIDSVRYNHWHSEPLFAEEFEKRTAALNRQALLYIAKYASLAAAKLVSLTDSANPEITRKACLDIIGLLSESNPKTVSSLQPSQSDDETNHPHISPELAEKLLAILAEEKISSINKR